MAREGVKGLYAGAASPLLGAMAHNAGVFFSYGMAKQVTNHVNILEGKAEGVLMILRDPVMEKTNIASFQMREGASRVVAGPFLPSPSTKHRGMCSSHRMKCDLYRSKCFDPERTGNLACG